MSLKTVHLDCIITLEKIDRWPPSKSQENIRSVSIKWTHNDKNSGSTDLIKGSVQPGNGGGVGDSIIKFTSNNSFEVHVALPAKGEPLVKNCIKVIMSAENSVNPILATGDIKLEDNGQEITRKCVEMTMKRKMNSDITLHPRLYVKIENRSYSKMYTKSIEDPIVFWSDIAKKFYWKQTWGDVYSENLDVNKHGGKINIKWFKDGVTNICHNCLDKNIESGKGDKTAFLWEGTGGSQSLTYKDLLKKVCQLANFLKKRDVQKGDRVIIYLPMIMKLPITMLACARIGAVHSVVVPGYSKDLLSHIIKECEPKIVVTCNKDTIKLKKNVHDALLEAKNDKCLVLVDENESAMTEEDTDKYNKDQYFNWKRHVAQSGRKKDRKRDACEVEWVGAEDPLFILYTSLKADPKPKGVLHTTGGYMTYTAETFKYAFDYKDSDDVYWCTADCGWITGHSYVVYGPLLNGAKVVLYEGIHKPNARRFWEIVEKHKVKLLYTSPKLLRTLKLAGDDKNVTSSCETLRVLGIVGEPLRDSERRWFFEVVGGSRCLISDIWWQTETGGFMITQKPDVKPGSDPVTFPFFGVKPVIVDEKGVEIKGERSGYLCSKSSWPGIFRDLYRDHDHQKYKTTYFMPFPGYNFSPSSRGNDGDRRLQERDVIYRLKHFRLETEFTRRPSVPYEENSEEFATRLGEPGEASTSAGPSGGK